MREGFEFYTIDMQKQSNYALKYFIINFLIKNIWVSLTKIGMCIFLS